MNAPAKVSPPQIILPPRIFVARTPEILTRAIDWVRNLDIDVRKPWAIACSKKLKPKTERQLGYYWGVVLPAIAAHTGNTTPDLHEELKEYFAPRVAYTFMGNARTRHKGLSEMDVEEASRLIDGAILLAGELGVSVPPPEDYYIDEVRRRCGDGIRQ